MRWAACAGAALALLACEEGVAQLPAPEPPDASRPGPEDEPPPEDTSRAPRARSPGRMTVEQLARSIPVVTGGISWVEDFGAGPIDILEVLSPTLGAPDYLRVTEENLEPTLLIAKFLQDASHRICTRWASADAAAPAAERTLVTHEDWSSLDEEEVRANLRRLQLRFYARRVPDGDDALVDPLYTLFVNASTTAPEARAAHDGWLAVCIAMMTDPEFVLY